MYAKKKGAEKLNEVISTKKGKRKKKSKETKARKDILDKHKINKRTCMVILLLQVNCLCLW